MQTRRELLKSALAALASTGLAPLLPGLRAAAAGADPLLGPPELPTGTLEGSALHALAGKKPLIRRTARPPNYETPVSYFEEAFTPADAFFVRYHLPGIPDLSPESWRLKIGGEAAEKPYELGLDELKREFEPVEVAALCYCAGNRRGLVQPHLTGIQWGHGAMGNGLWRGARLKDLLGRAGIRGGALEVAADGAEMAPGRVPDFVKSLPVWKALDENTLVAYELNGQPIPRWNGFPARLIVPGWASSYWIKHLVTLELSSQPFKGFWMQPAYRLPKGVFATVDRFASQETDTTVPITDLVANSFITSPQPGRRFGRGSRISVRGLAWDGGRGIAQVEISSDGRSWQPARLGKDLGRYSWRQWSFDFKPARPGSYTLAARATNRIGQTQTTEFVPNPSGYHHNVIQRVTVTVT